MNEELRLHIKKLQNRAIFSLIAILSTIISIGFGFLFLFIPSFVAIVFFVISIICIAYLIYSNRIAKKDESAIIGKPVVFNADKNFSFEEIITFFENSTDNDNQLSATEDLQFFRLNKIFKSRTVLYRTADFNKKDFDTAKDRINKKANKVFNITHWVNRTEASKMMRFNIIFTDTLNNELYQLISQNANRNLARVEGIVNIAIIGNSVMIPPIYGECDLAEISRYKNVIKFINQVILNK